MGLQYEEGRQRLHEFVRWYSNHAGGRNEATTRLHLIDRLFFDCLGWLREDATLEEADGQEYADYTFSTSRRVLIVEAKKEGTYFELPQRKERPQYSIRGLYREYRALGTALDQAISYAQKRGVPYAVVANGHQLVAVLATRTDGIAPQSGDALVFTSLAAMADRFLELWRALSKEGMQDNRLTAILAGSRTALLPGKLAAEIPGYPGFKNRNVFQVDLQVVTELVLEDMARADALETRFLQDCYCPSGALSQCSLVSKRILETRYAALFESDAPITPVNARDGSAVGPEVLAKSLSKRPILLVGDVGVGKTMFIRHLMRVDAPQVFSDALTFYVDLGSRAVLADTLRTAILDELTGQLRALYDIDVEESSFVRGVYNVDLLRFGKGVHAELREVDPTGYKKEELGFLIARLADRPEHLRRSLEHIQKGRRKQIILFVDNLDQRTDDIQQRAFLIAHEMADHWPVVVFLSLRPETFARSTRGGVLAGYHPKAFTISPPRIDRVLLSRLEFAKKLTSGEILVDALGGRAIVSFAKLDTMLDAFLHSLQGNPDIVECIDNVSGGNVRLALDLTRSFFGSGHVDTQKIVELFPTSRGYRIPLHEFLRAITYGDCAYYDPSYSVITNLVDLHSTDRREHFLLPCMLAHLLAMGSRAGDDGFVDAAGVFDEMQSLGYVPEQIDRGIAHAVERRLMTTMGHAQSVEDHGGRRCRITSVGAYHVRKLLSKFTYLDAIVVNTPILDLELRTRIKDVSAISQRLERCGLFCDYLSASWQQMSAKSQHFDWDAVAEDLRAELCEIREAVDGRNGGT
ncbi:MAG TPA: hypothetical protein VGM03_20380 [Phycisphaerae bacterium]